MCSSFPGLLIGRTAVHSGKDPAFVAYDQFLSTGILQPLSRGEVRCGSKPVKLGTSKCFQVCPRKRTYLPILELLPPPALGERRHRGLARGSQPFMLTRRKSFWSRSTDVSRRRFALRASVPS